jgi:hypothetical protein
LKELTTIKIETQNVMNYFIRIFSKDCSSLSPQEVIAYIEDGFFFEPEPEIILDKKDDSNWSIKIVYDKNRSPVIISTADQDIGGNKRIEQVKFILGLPVKSETKDKFKRFLEEVCRIYTFEIVQEEITDDCWEMLDATEAMILGKCDGILLTGDNEFFDKDLKKIYKL